MLVLSLVLIPISSKRILNDIKYKTRSIERSVEIQNYLNEKSPAISLWDYAPVQDFLYIWIRGWSAGIFDSELKDQRPDLYELKADYKTVHLSYSDKTNVSDICWDAFIIREERADVFLDLYGRDNFGYEEIGKTKIWNITQKNCVTKL
jgi:hypothetical protein